MEFEAAGTRRLPLSRWLFAVAVTVLSATLLWVAARAHLEYSCTVKDTPYLPICPETSPDPGDLRSELRDRIHRNPGDSWAWTLLLPVTADAEKEAVLRGATAVAPNNATVLRWRAAAALDRGELEEAISLLVQLLEYRGSRDAAGALAQLASTPEGRELLQGHIKDSKRWFPRVLDSFSALKLPPGDVLPLVVEAAKQDALPPSTRRAYMQQLRARGQLLDAYGLWLTLHKRQVPLLYNGSFDNAFVPEGFDWEFTSVTRSRAGVVVEQQPGAKRGLVLELEFTGRRFALPILRQLIFAPGGAYRLEGEYMASKFRSEGGLNWVVYCTSNGSSLLAKGSPIQDSGGIWRTFEMDFKVPADCGPIASLQLEPAQKYEAAAGIRGHVELDALKITRVED
ncbi:MAG TPA: tetratricopeptide repeat protein [Ramlibacter sp.]|uniref:tetratricopeptide repeat protein n=1 Tax=Ramlibacter sp. TaxID=1917967 RepID=UPI002ED35575